jgi:hypothetical protein
VLWQEPSMPKSMGGVLDGRGESRCSPRSYVHGGWRAKAFAFLARTLACGGVSRIRLDADLASRMLRRLLCPQTESLAPKSSTDE